MIKEIIAIIIAILTISCIAIPILSEYQNNGADTLDIVVIAGQSNGVYYTDYVDVNFINENLPQPPTNCLYYGNGYLHNMSNNGAWSIGNLDPAIAYQISKMTNDNVLVINSCVGGKNIEYFTPGHDGAIFIDTVLTTALSRVAGYSNVNKIAWVWVQGESDAETPITDYIADFSKINAMFSEYGFKSCWISQTRAENGGNATLAQEKIVSTYNNVSWGSTASQGFTTTNGLLANDGLHYTQAGRLIIGNDIGESIAHSLPLHACSLPITSLISVIPIIMTISIILAAVGLIGIKKFQ